MSPTPSAREGTKRLVPSNLRKQWHQEPSEKFFLHRHLFWNEKQVIFQCEEDAEITV
jgi:hypothetical protein